jgi:hypothetical protein
MITWNLLSVTSFLGCCSKTAAESAAALAESRVALSMESAIRIWASILCCSFLRASISSDVAMPSCDLTQSHPVTIIMAMIMVVKNLAVLIIG